MMDEYHGASEACIAYIRCCAHSNFISKICDLLRKYDSCRPSLLSPSPYFSTPPQTSFTDDTNTIPSRNGARCSSAGSRCVAAFRFVLRLPSSRKLFLAAFPLSPPLLFSLLLFPRHRSMCGDASLFIILILRFYFVFLRTFFRTTWYTNTRGEENFRSYLALHMRTPITVQTAGNGKTAKGKNSGYVAGILKAELARNRGEIVV